MDIKKRNPYREVDHAQGDEHPIDVEVQNHLAVKVLARKVIAVTEQLQDALQKSDSKSLWLVLEPLLNEYRQLREEIAFNTGFQYGHVNGEVRSFQLLMGKSMGVEYRQLADHLRDVTLQSGLSISLGAAALLEIAWSMIAGIEEEK